MGPQDSTPLADFWPPANIGFMIPCGAAASRGYLGCVTRISRAVVALLTLVGLVVAVAPLQADEGHCAGLAVAAAPAVHAHGHGAVAPSGDALTTNHGCPACPVSSCGAMHGCSATSQVSPEVVVARVALLPDRQVLSSVVDAVPASISHAPPTPPPLAALSPA
jgi:hypothetical protein